jgi:hypothetical protein
MSIHPKVIKDSVKKEIAAIEITLYLLKLKLKLKIKLVKHQKSVFIN